MRSGKVMEEGPSEQIFASPQNDYTKALMAAAFNIQAVRSEAVQSVSGSLGTSRLLIRSTDIGLSHARH